MLEDRKHYNAEISSYFTVLKGGGVLVCILCKEIILSKPKVVYLKQILFKQEPKLFRISNIWLRFYTFCSVQ